jgi:3-oxoacyl-[acyl-carrier protein] reductase
MIDPRIQNKIALVTGGNSGIGAAICAALAAQGARVAVHYHPGTAQEGDLHTVLGYPETQRIVESLRVQGYSAIAVGADLLKESSAIELFNEVERELGFVDILINNAAHCETSDTLEKIDAGVIDRHFAVNTRAAELLSQQLSRRKNMRKESGGCIVNISTDGARVFAGQIAYGASKYALEAFTRSMAVELGSFGIRVNTIAPGPVQTGWITKELEAKVLDSIPLRRLGTPEDIADSVVFLCSDQASWITGQIIQVAGGHAL